MNEPRHQHYVFAHRYLPNLFFGDPVRFFGALESGGDAFLHWLWKRCESEAKDGVVIPPTGLEAHLFRFDDETLCACITLPQPLGITEAYWVAAVYRPERETPPGARFVAFYTLEFGYDLDDEPRTVLGSWSADGTHSNFGDGPEASMDAFLEWVVEKVESHQ